MYKNINLISFLFRIMVVILFCVVSCGDPSGPGDDEEDYDGEPIFLVRGQSRTDDYSGTIWYYFNSSVLCNYEILLFDVDSGSYTGNSTISLYHSDMETPFFENQGDGIKSISSNTCERIYIKIENGHGNYNIGYNIDNTSPPETWTLMLYMSTDQDVDYIHRIQELINGYHVNCNINIIILLDKRVAIDFGLDGFDFDDTRMFVINTQGVHRISGANEFPEITEESVYEANMRDANTLKKFINYCKANYPAKYNSLFIFGLGSAAGGVCDDGYGVNDRLHPGEISAVLDNTHSVDLLVFAACIMGNLETAYQYRKDPGNSGFSADYMIGPPCHIWPYERMDLVLERINTEGGTNGETEVLTGGEEQIYSPYELLPPDLAKIIVEEYRDAMYGLSDALGDVNKMSCYDLTQVTDVKNAVDNLAECLYGNNEKYVEDIRDDETKVSYYYYSNPDPDEEIIERKYTPYYELYDICYAIANDMDDNFSNETKDAASETLTSIGNLIKYSYYGSNTENKYGLSIFFTNGDDEYEGHYIFEYQWWYNADRVDESDYGNIPEKNYYGEIASCRDGATAGNNDVENWFELLDAWYDTGGNGVDGGVNGYQY